ncbi:ankyrin repeat-containing domain protein [Cristinia sonorae]|uniref:Ankyrin repeat-containing domain protein n=1 Tax=Cristinia sonorae TaxID=1940300 RepID=A0A8K0XTV4_9AGAR|nr:ankyrin repeat-containing domain protein [Cristinia sonorae]
MAEKDAATRLRRAVKDNNLFIVKRLCKKIDMRNPDPMNKRYTSLAWAAVLGHEETFEFLLSEGHDDREYSKDSENNTILLLLADTRAPLSSPMSPGPSDHDFYSATLRMAKLYYDRYPDILDWANVQGRTALHVAALKGNEELVRMLCDFGADIDLADDEGNTALHYASAWGHIPIVQLLIERGCQYSVRNNEGFTPSDYAYSTNTKDVLQDTARAQFELNKRSRRNVFAQAAARGHEWGSLASHMPPPPPPRMYHGNGVRMRSGSGTSRTTTTSDSGDYYENYSTPQPSRSHPTLSSSLSPTRQPMTLPSAFSPGQPSVSSAGSVSTFSTVPSPAPAQSMQGSLSVSSALSQYASRMREQDANAIEKYKNRQRSGSGTTASTDVASQNGGNHPLASGVSRRAEDDIAALGSLVTVGSVAPRRNLRPSASAAQLRSPASGGVSSSNQTPVQEVLRNRSGTGPATMGPIPPIATQSPSDPGLSSTPTQRPVKGPFKGPSTEFSRFPPPPLAAPRESTESTRPNAPTHTTQTRRLPFGNLLSSHHKHNSDHTANHKRNSSLGTRVA